MNVSKTDSAAKASADVVIYDGQCGFCRAQVDRLARWDGRGRLCFLSLHDPQVAERFPDLTHSQLMHQMYVVANNGRRYAGASAVRYLIRRLPRLWPLVPLVHFPLSLPIWQWLYRQIARRRDRLNPSYRCDDACGVKRSAEEPD
jgi:predicted DCC family thiol-disulfide oxidoreductase YuxK